MGNRKTIIAILIALAFMMPMGLTFSSSNVQADTTAGWSSVIVNNADGQYADFKDIKVDAAGHVHIVMALNQDLWYWTNKTGPWTHLSIDTVGTKGNFPSLAVDASGNAHIAYKVQVSSIWYMKYITNAPTGGIIAGSFTPNKVTLLTNPYSNWNPILVDASGNPHVYAVFRLPDPWQLNITEYTKVGASWTNVTLAANVGGIEEMSAVWDGTDIRLAANEGSDLTLFSKIGGVWSRQVVIPGWGAPTGGSRIAITVDSSHIVYLSYWEWVSSGVYPLRFTNNSGTGWIDNLVSIQPDDTGTDFQVAMSLWNNIPIVTYQYQNNIMLAMPTKSSVPTVIDVGSDLYSNMAHPGYEVAMDVRGTTIYILHHGYPAANPSYESIKLRLDMNIILPGAPGNLRTTPGNGEVKLAWDAASTNGGPAITNYTIYRSQSTGTETYLNTTIGPVLYFNDTTVTNDLTYYYYVRAVNSFGASENSNENYSTPKALPGVATILSAVPGDHSVTLTWSAAAPNGASISAYHVYRSTVSGQEAKINQTAGTVLSLTDTVGLVNGVKYYYTVSAVSPNGWGPNSTEVNATPLWFANAPSVTAVSGNAQVVLNWVAPTDNGGAAVTNYTVYFGTTSTLSLLTNVSATTLTYTKTGLTNGNVYYFGVAAVNAKGEGPKGLANTTPSATPQAPTAPINVVATGGSGHITLVWNAPSSAGSQPITDYKIYRGDSASALAYWGHTGSTVPTFNDTGLMTSMTYYYTIVAVNSVGDGPQSVAAHATTSATPPTGAPASVSNVAVSPGDGSVAVSWTAPSSATAITNYYVYRATVNDPTKAVLIANLSGSVLNFADTTAVSGQTYYYWIVTSNSIGASDSAASQAVSPGAAKSGDSLLPIILIVVVIIVVVVLVLFLFMRKKKAAPAAPPAAAPLYQATQQQQYQQQPASVPGICSKCGTPVSADFAVCPNCGNKLK
jgi:hypothetical protein